MYILLTFGFAESFIFSIFFFSLFSQFSNSSMSGIQRLKKATFLLMKNKLETLASHGKKGKKHRSYINTAVLRIKSDKKPYVARILLTKTHSLDNLFKFFEFFLQNFIVSNNFEQNNQNSS